MRGFRHHLDRVTSNPAILTAFDQVDRRHFLPSAQRSSASLDQPLPIGHGQTNSQPSTVAGMLDMLEVEAGHRVLDVGSGSGWTTALLGHLVGPKGSVIGVELVAELAQQGAENLATYDLPWASIIEATPGVLGDPANAPFDRILVSAGAKTLPDELVDQLTPTGLMVVPVAGRMTIVRRHPGQPDEITHHGQYRFVPLL
ncbi:MAG: protein-L-isoaspartate carboxylmethyltransferase [Aquihabitans sp.]